MHFTSAAPGCVVITGIEYKNHAEMVCILEFHSDGLKKRKQKYGSCMSMYEWMANKPYFVLPSFFLIYSRHIHPKEIYIFQKHFFSSAWLCQQSSWNRNLSVVRPSVSQLSLNFMHRFLSNFSCGFPWAICSDIFWIFEKKFFFDFFTNIFCFR